MADENTPITETKRPKKRRVLGRKSDCNKRLKLSSHETGPDCLCKRFHCFLNVQEIDQNRIIAHINSLDSKAEQDAYIAKYIELVPVKRRRSRQENNENVSQHEFSYQYYASTLANDKFNKVPVCIKAFCSLHGVSTKRVRYIRDSLASSGNMRTKKM